MRCAPIALFTYNRVSHTKNTIEHLLQNHLASNSDLYVYSDAAKYPKDEEQVSEIREYVSQLKGFKSVTKKFQTTNKGLARSIIEGVNEIVQNHDTIIVLEDDLITSVNFLTYINKALEFYTPENTWSISGYSPVIKRPENYAFDTYLAYRNCSWGWATWKENWEKTDWNVKDFNSFIKDPNQRDKFNRGGNDLSIMLLKQQEKQIQSWSIRFNYASFQYNLPTVYPFFSMVNNMGTDGTGTNMKRSNKFNSNYTKSNIANIFCPEDLIHPQIQRDFKLFYNTSLQRKIINWYKINKYISQRTTK